MTYNRHNPNLELKEDDKDLTHDNLIISAMTLKFEDKSKPHSISGEPRSLSNYSFLTKTMKSDGVPKTMESGGVCASVSDNSFDGISMLGSMVSHGVRWGFATPKC